MCKILIQEESRKDLIWEPAGFRVSSVRACQSVGKPGPPGVGNAYIFEFAEVITSSNAFGLSSHVGVLTFNVAATRKLYHISTLLSSSSLLVFRLQASFTESDLFTVAL